MALPEIPAIRKTPPLDLVATQTPKGRVVLIEHGVTPSPEEDIETVTKARALGVIKNFTYVRGSDVGLEWRLPNGDKMPSSDRWAQNSFVAIAKSPNNITIDKYGQPVTRAGANLRKRWEVVAADRNLSDQQLKEWIEYHCVLEQYVDAVRNGNGYPLYELNAPNNRVSD